MTILGVTASSILKANYAFESIATASGALSTFSLTSIPSTYSHLRIHYYFQGGTSSYGPYFTFNGDTTSGAYSMVESYAKGSTVVGGAGGISVAPYIEIPGAYGNSVQAGEAAYGIIEINNYKSTTMIKETTGYGGLFWTTSNSRVVAVASGRWNSTAAITSITFTTGITTNASSYVALYGVK